MRPRSLVRLYTVSLRCVVRSSASAIFTSQEKSGDGEAKTSIGNGGFIGHHLVKRLKSDGHWVRGVDIKYPEYEASASDEFEILRFAQGGELPAGHARWN
jgi:hypothetical protein